MSRLKWVPPEGQKPSKCPCLTKLPGGMCPQLIVSKVLSWGVIRKSACLLADITIRKSQSFGTSITASATQMPLCGSKAAQHWRKEAFEDSGFYPTGQYGDGGLLWLKQSRINPYLHGAAELVSGRECYVYCGVYEPQPGFLWFSRGGIV